MAEHWQAGRFIGHDLGNKPSSRSLLAVQVGDLLLLASRFVGEERARQSFMRFAYRQGKGFDPSQAANSDWIAHTERLLAGVLGASSTRAVVKAAIEGREMQVEDVVRIVDEASEVLQFNRALLQGCDREHHPGHQRGRPVAAPGGLEPPLYRAVQLPRGPGVCRPASGGAESASMPSAACSVAWGYRGARQQAPVLDAPGHGAHLRATVPQRPGD